MLSTANGKNALSARVTLPRTGVWHVDLVVDTQTPSDVAGAVALSLLDGQLTLSGTSYRAPALWRGLTHVRIAAGASGLGTELAAQGYTNAPTSLIVGDILSGAGEKLSSSAMPLTARMNWARVAGEAGDALWTVVDKLGATWRSLPDGTVWIGTESWPAATLTDYQITDNRPEDARLELVTGTPSLLPGQTFAGGNIGRVVYRIAEDSFRTEVFFE